MQQLKGLLGEKTGGTEPGGSKHVGDHLYIRAQPSMANAEKCSRRLHAITAVEKQCNNFKDLSTWLSPPSENKHFY